jgi:hypothetical protein
MSNANLGETLGNLEGMATDLSTHALLELRGGYRPDIRQRLEKVMTGPNGISETRGGHRVSGTGGNSPVFLMKNNKLTTEHTYGVSARYLRVKDNDLTIAIYPFGIQGLTQDSRPIFENPKESKMRSVVIEYDRYTDNVGWLQRRVEPLFNIEEDGSVYARISDQPTSGELQLINDIIEEFESI